jgi:ATP-binding cassette subfamily B protein
MSVERLRQLAGTTEQGTSLAGLAKAAKALGLQAEGVQVSRDALAQIEMPALAWVNGNHYIAALSVHGEGEHGTAVIHDPNAASEQTIPQEQLLRQCSGYLLLVHR